MKPQVTEAHRAAALDYCLKFGWNPDAQPEVAAMLAEHDAAILARAEAAEALVAALSDKGKRLLAVVCEREPVLEAAYRQSDVELDHNFGTNDRALIEAHQAFVAALAMTPDDTGKHIAWLEQQHEALRQRSIAIQEILNRCEIITSTPEEGVAQLARQRDALIAAGDAMLERLTEDDGKPLPFCRSRIEAFGTAKQGALTMRT